MEQNFNERFHHTINKIDELNSQDPNTIKIKGKNEPWELVHSRAMSDWVEKLEPEASEELKIAARSQHICRWKIPREDYPEGKNGYLKWRNDLKKYHADLTAQIMEENGYPENIIERVKNLNLKKGLKKDPEAQTIEDALCLVFMEYLLEDFAREHSREKMKDILSKTWKKMSDKSKEEAKKLNFSPEIKSLVQEAIKDVEEKA